MNIFKTIGILAKPSDDRIEETLRHLHTFLLQQNIEVLTLNHAARFLSMPSIDHQQFVTQIDLAIVVGGDGTFLNAGRSLVNHNIPIVGINLGRLGFLVDVSPHEMAKILKPILQGHYIAELRSLLSAEIYRKEQCIGRGDAMNDVVIHARNQVRMIEYTTHIDQCFVNTQRADGIIIATPTGSTAYALSGGGPLLHPSLNAVSLVPICPHTLSYRPIVVNSDSTIEITLCKQSNTNARVSFDGQAHIDLQVNDKLVITKKEPQLQLIHPKNYDYYHILREKLHWSVHP